MSAVVAWYAPSDVAAVATDLGADPADPTTREAQLLGAPAPRPCPSSPRRPARSRTCPPAAPPFLLLHGAADRLIPCVQSERLHAALVEAGVEVELDLYEGADHMWLGSPEAARAGTRPHDRLPAAAAGRSTDEGRRR